MVRREKAPCGVRHRRGRPALSQDAGAGRRYELRLPTEDELDALEAFQLSLGRQKDLNLNPDPKADNARFNCTSFPNACGSGAVFKLMRMKNFWKHVQRHSRAR